MNTLKLRILFGFIVLIVAQSSNLLSQYGGYGSMPSSIMSSVPGSINPAITDPTAAFNEAAANSPYQTCWNIDTSTDECPPDWPSWLLGPFSGGAGGGGCGSSCSPGNGAGGSPRLSPPIMPRLHSKVPVQYNSYTVGNSKIDNQRFNYWHWSVDAPRTAGSSLGIGRIHRTRDWSTPGSFGPGVFSNLGLRLNIAVNAWCQQGYCHEVSVFDPTSRSPIFAILPSSIIEGNDSLEPRAKNVEFFDAQMQPLSGMTQSSYDPPLPIPSFCKMNLWDGSFFKFQLINVEVPPSDSSYATPTHGRLIEAKTTDGNGYSITYKSWTQQELEASPNRLWQMDTASDISGTSFGISYSVPNKQADG